MATELPVVRGFYVVRGIYVVREIYVARGFIPVRLRSDRKTCGCGMTERVKGSASHSNGDKSPRHINPLHHINPLTNPFTT